MRGIFITHSYYFCLLLKKISLNTSIFFNTFFHNAKFNGILIMNKDGVIVDVNKAFNLRFGYSAKDLVDKNFSVLFTEKDQADKKPEKELRQTITEGSSNDENYLVNKEGNKVWVTGESVLIEHDTNTYLVKVVHNIHAQKQLERFLLQSHEFIDTVFDSIEESALLMLDTRLRILKANKTFVEMFELNGPVEKGSRISELENAFWQKPEVKQEAINFLVMHNVSETKIFEMETKTGEIKKISFQGKLVEGVPGIERKLLVMIKFLP